MGGADWTGIVNILYLRTFHPQSAFRRARKGRSSAVADIKRTGKLIMSRAGDSHKYVKFGMRLSSCQLY